ncbi:hypothetical protein AYR66_04590 [Noviherbaspirillum denitrificans]|uniref:Uncharacterized protein n=1 Tax=Noviherbaspirillum denitrificans TaxID=1968433 RepID=A0A254T9M7_9BURK|nr:hypothetical protein AYR66_04590 [Noviherbaspirillum denitrificans]
MESLRRRRLQQLHPFEDDCRCRQFIAVDTAQQQYAHRLALLAVFCSRDGAHQYGKTVARGSAGRLQSAFLAGRRIHAGKPRRQPLAPFGLLGRGGGSGERGDTCCRNQQRDGFANQSHNNVIQ